MDSHNPLVRVLLFTFALCLMLCPATLRADDPAGPVAPAQVDDVAAPAPDVPAKADVVPAPAQPAPAVIAKPVIVATLPPVLVLDSIPVVALQPMADLLGATVTVDAITHKIVVVGNGHTFSCALGSLDATKDDHAGHLKLAPFIRGEDYPVGTIYVPYIPLLKSLDIKEDYPTSPDPQALPGNPPATTPPPALPPTTTSFTPPGKDAAITLMVASFPGAGEFREYTPQLFSVPYHTASPDGTDVRRISYSLVAEKLPAVSSDGKSLLFARDGDIWARDVTSPCPKKLLTSAIDGSMTYTDVSYTPDGKQLLLLEAQKDATGMTSTVNLADLDGGHEKRIAVGTHPMLRPDGAWVSFLTADPSSHQIGAYISQTDALHPRLVDDLARNLVFSPDSTLIALSVLVPPVSSRAVAPFPMDKYAVVVIRLPAKDTKPQKFILAEADRGSLLPHPVFSPGGSKLLFIKEDGLYLISKLPDDGTKLTFSTPSKFCDGNRISMARFTPDGKQIIYLVKGDLYSVDPAGTIKPLTRMQSVRDFTFDPNGLLLFTAFVERPPVTMLGQFADNDADNTVTIAATPPVTPPTTGANSGANGGTTARNGGKNGGGKNGGGKNGGGKNGGGGGRNGGGRNGGGRGGGRGGM